MEKQTQENTFTYTYSSAEQEEIRKIREKYVPREPDKMEQLRMLDRGVGRKGTKYSIILGLVGTLIMGSGMSLVMVGASRWLVPGIVVGVLGMAVMSVAYPLYLRITKEEREKIAPEILRLTEELMR